MVSEIVAKVAGRPEPLADRQHHDGIGHGHHRLADHDPAGPGDAVVVRQAQPQAVGRDVFGFQLQVPDPGSEIAAGESCACAVSNVKNPDIAAMLPWQGEDLDGFGILSAFPRATPRRGPCSAARRPPPAARSARGSTPTGADRPARRSTSTRGPLRAARRAQHAGADRRHPRRGRPLRLGRRDRLAAQRRARQAAQGHRRAPDPCHQPARLRLDAARHRGQRRPQPQLRRPRQGLSAERGLCRPGRRRPAP